MDTKALSRRETSYGETCAYWLTGRCTRNPCRFLHKEKPLRTTAHHYVTTTNHYWRQSHYSVKKTPEDDSNNLVNKNSGDGPSTRKGTQKSSRSVCKYWMNGNCTHGDRCWNFHSWFQGNGLSMVAQLHEHRKIVTGIVLPVGSDKLFSGSTDGTVRIWDCHNGQCVSVINLGGEVRSVICEGTWVFAGMPNAVKAWNIQTAAEFTLDGPKGQVLAMAVGNDTLLAGAKDGVIYA